MNDLRYAFRQLLKTPGFTTVAVLTLALGIGANTAIFSVINAVLLRPLPYPNSDRLVQIWQTNPRANRWGAWVSYPDFLDWRQHNTSFEEVGAFRPWGFNLTGGDHPEALRGSYVTADLFTVLKVKPLFGRTFLPEEDQPGGNHVAALSHGLWQRRFAADPTVVGKTISIDTQAHTVVGVMPPSFSFPDSRSEIWIPHGPPSELKARGSHNFRVVARLKPGVTLKQAQANMDAIALGLAEQHSENREMGVTVSNLKLAAVGEVRSALFLLLGAVGLVLLIACANVANLLIARNTVRLHEVAVRQAVGASRMRLIRQLLTESVLLAFVGGVAGLALAYGGLEIVVKLSPEIPRLGQTTIDTAVLATTLLVSLERMNSMPGVRSASLSTATPVRGGMDATLLFVSGVEPRSNSEEIKVSVVAPRYFETMGMPLLAGRDFSPQDGEQSPKVAMVSESMARHYFPNENPLGRRFSLTRQEAGEEREIIGVVKDARFGGLRKENTPIVYLSHQQDWTRPSVNFALRTTGDPASLIATVRSTIQSLGKDIPVTKINTLAALTDEVLAQERLVATLSGFFGLLGLVLACVGLFGLVSYAVARRTNEIGIRMALGAQGRDVLGLIMRETMLLVLPGVALGLGAAVVTTRFISSLLFGLAATDPWTLMGAALLMSVLAAFAGYLPAQRAAKVDPMEALRHE